jgi:hypothetical protein
MLGIIGRFTLDLGTSVGPSLTRPVGIDNGDDQGDGTLLLAISGEKIEVGIEGVIGGILDLVERNGSIANDLIKTSLLVEDLNVEIVVTALIVVIEDDDLIPLDVVASILLGRGGTEAVLVFLVNEEQGIGVVLAHVLNVLEAVGTFGFDVEGLLGHGGLCCWGKEEKKKRVWDGERKKEREEREEREGTYTCSSQG